MITISRFIFFVVLVSISTISAQQIQSSSLEIGPIKGELCFIEDCKPNVLVIFVPNSGPVDKNGNQSYQRNNVVKLLVESLAIEGYASCRYDKILTPRRGSVSRETFLFFF